MRLFDRSIVFTAGMTVAASLIAHDAAAQTFQGPSSSQPPYVLPTAPGWEVASIITTGDFARNDYQMVGIPDGLGALAGRFRNGQYVNRDKYITVFMNHEIPTNSPGPGAQRAHGASGAFVSQWTINIDTLRVRAGQDLIEEVFLYNTVTGQYAPAITPVQFNRFCSADLPEPRAFYNPRTGKGFNGRMFMDGEETTDGRAFAHVVTGAGKGNSFNLPHIGRMAFENTLAHPDAGDKTIVVAMDDTTPGQVYFYIGQKRSIGNPVERAGLVGGKLYGLKVTDGGANYGGGAVDVENAGAVNGAFSLESLDDVSLITTTAALDALSDVKKVTKFARPEDGFWDTQDPKVYYFVTTGADVDLASGATHINNQSARLYKLTLNSLLNPTGGTIELIVDRKDLPDFVAPAAGTGITAMFDNITVDGDGNVIVQEDPGGNAYIAKTWKVNPDTKVAVEILHSNPTFFGNPPGSSFLTVDEESSGVIEVTDLVRSARWFERGRRYFLADLQDHHTAGVPANLVEGGQLYLVASAKRFHLSDPGDHRHHRHDKDGNCEFDRDDRDDNRHDHHDDWHDRDEDHNSRH